MSAQFQCRLVEEPPIDSPDDQRFEGFLSGGATSGMGWALADLLRDEGIDPGADTVGWARFRELAEPALRADPTRFATYPALLDAYRNDPTGMTPDDLAIMDFQWMLQGLRAAVLPASVPVIRLAHLRLELASASAQALLPPADAVGSQRELLVRLLGDLQPRGHDTPVRRFLDAIDGELFFASLWQPGLGAQLESAGVGIVPFFAQGEVTRLACGPDALDGIDAWWARDPDVVAFAASGSPDPLFACTYDLLVHPAWLPERSARHPGPVFPAKAWFS